MYDVTFAPQVVKRLRKLPKREQERLIGAALGLRKFPTSGEIRRLVGGESYFRLKVGKWRYIFWVDRRGRAVRITKLDTRGDVYQ